MNAGTFPIAHAPADPPSPVSVRLPAGACDTHVHMVAGPDDFPLWQGRVEDPAPGSYDDWIGRFARHMDILGVDRTVIVHSILYGGDNAITVETVRRLGARARGIGLVRDHVSDADLDALAEAGIVGIRLNYVHGGLLSWDGAKALAPRLAARGMHIQMLMNADQHLDEIARDIAALPVPVVFDHLGWPDLSAGIQETGFAGLCRLVADGDAYVKLSGIYRLCDAPYDRTADHVRALVNARADRCLWGSDWPHIMLNGAKMPDAGVLLDAFLDVVTSDAERRTIFVDAPSDLYRFS